MHTLSEILNSLLVVGQLVGPAFFKSAHGAALLSEIEAGIKTAAVVTLAAATDNMTSENTAQ